MATKNILLTIGTGGSSVDFIVRGNAEAYGNLAAVTNSGFTAKEADATDNAKTLGVITPTTALLASGAFERVNLSSSDGKKSRTAIVPSGSVSIIKNAVQATGGLSVDSVVCTSLSSGLRRAPR
jgi:hypothetical protein